MQDLMKIGIVVVLGVFAMLSLSVAARGHHDLTYWGGLGFFIFLVLLAFYATANLTAHHKGHNGH